MTDEPEALQEQKWAQGKQRERDNLVRDSRQHARQRDLQAQFEGRKPIQVRRPPAKVEQS